MDIVYLELNNWFSDRDFPNAEPFLTGVGDTSRDDEALLNNEEWIKENKLCAMFSVVGQSFNGCITAKREWVETNCPKLLGDESTVTTFEVTDENGTTGTVTYLPYRISGI